MTEEKLQLVIPRHEATWIEVSDDAIRIVQDDTTGNALDASLTIEGKGNVDRFIAALVKARGTMR